MKNLNTEEWLMSYKGCRSRRKRSRSVTLTKLILRRMFIENEKYFLNEIHLKNQCLHQHSKSMNQHQLPTSKAPNRRNESVRQPASATVENQPINIVMMQNIPNSNI